MVRGPHIANRC